MRRHLLLLLAVLALLAGACGTDEAADGVDERPDAQAAPDPDEAGADAAATLAAASRATADAGSAAMWTELRIDGMPGPDGQPQTVAMVSEGVFDFDAERGHMTMDMSELFTGLPDFDPADAAMEVINDGMVMWMRAPLFTEMLGVPTPWLRMDLDELARQEAGVDLGELQQLSQQSDPTQFLAFLQGATDDVTALGEEDVRGVTTVRYDATVDVRRVYEDADLIRDREPFEAFIAELGVTTMEVSVWIDGDGLVRRQQFDLPMPDLPTGATATMTIELFDYGIDVDVTPPPDDQVTDLIELMASLEQ